MRRNLAWWRAHAKSSCVIRWVAEGFTLLWRADKGAPAEFQQPNQQSCFEARNKQFVTDSVHKLCQAGAVEKWPTRPRCVSPLSVVPKKLGKLRLVLNLRYVNEHLITPKFKYEALRDLSFLARPGDLMFSVD